MTLVGDLERPVVPEPHHWWRRIGEILTMLRHLVEHVQTRDSFELAIDEYSTLQSTAMASLTVPAQTINPVLITGFITYSSASAATVMIGDRVIPVPQGLFVATSLQMIRREKQDSLLVPTTPGQLYLEVMGSEQPRMSI